MDLPLYLQAIDASLSPMKLMTLGMLPARFSRLRALCRSAGSWWRASLTGLLLHDSNILIAKLTIPRRCPAWKVPSTSKSPMFSLRLYNGWRSFPQFVAIRWVIGRLVMSWLILSEFCWRQQRCDRMPLLSLPTMGERAEEVWIAKCSRRVKKWGELRDV